MRQKEGKQLCGAGESWERAWDCVQNTKCLKPVTIVLSGPQASWSGAELVACSPTPSLAVSLCAYVRVRRRGERDCRLVCCLPSPLHHLRLCPPWVDEVMGGSSGPRHFFPRGPPWLLVALSKIHGWQTKPFSPNGFHYLKLMSCALGNRKKCIFRKIILNYLHTYEG